MWGPIEHPHPVRSRFPEPQERALRQPDPHCLRGHCWRHLPHRRRRPNSCHSPKTAEPPPPLPLPPAPPFPAPVPPSLPSAATVATSSSPEVTLTFDVIMPPSPPGQTTPTPLEAALPLPPTAVTATLVTPFGTTTEYDPAVLEENRVAVVAPAGPTPNVVLAATETVVRPPNINVPTARARTLLPPSKTMAQTTFQARGKQTCLHCGLAPLHGACHLRSGTPY